MHSWPLGMPNVHLQSRWAASARKRIFTRPWMQRSRRTALSFSQGILILMRLTTNIMMRKFAPGLIPCVITSGPLDSRESGGSSRLHALACGTPVIAFPSGALPDIVEHGKTGFIVRNANEMADAIHAVASINPEQCRAAARHRFMEDRMIAKYFDLYHRLCCKEAS